jgi:uncharacterized protein YhfF
MTDRWTFDNDELFDLVACGKKHGTCSLFSNDDSLARVGDINIIYNSNNEQIRIKITNVHKCRFCDMDENWAKTEGEGDLSLAYWRRVHHEFFTSLKPEFKETGMLELNEFILCV